MSIYGIHMLHVNIQCHGNIEHSSSPSSITSLSEDKIAYLIKGLDSSKSNESDGISAKMLKSIAETIAPSLTHLFITKGA